MAPSAIKDVRQRTFAGGEISPTLYGRDDIAKYDTALRLCRNWIVTPHGSVVNRAGTRYVAETKSSGVVRLIPFNFSDDQTFVLEFGASYIRFYWNGGQVLSGGSPYELATPYAAADLPKIKYAQSGDVITLVHPSYEPRELRRISNTNWTLTVIAATRPAAPVITGWGLVFDGSMPHYSSTAYNAAKIYQGGYSCTDDNGLGTTHGYRSLQDNNVGHTPRDNLGSWWTDEGTVYPTLNHIDTPSRPARVWEWVLTTVSTGGVESLPSVVITANVDTSNPNVSARISLFSDRPVILSWPSVAGVASYNIYRGRDGVYGFVGEVEAESPTTTYFTDNGDAPDYSINPPEEVAPFVGAGNYPGSVTFYQQRRWFGATTNGPQTIWGSQVGNYNIFDSSLIPKDDDGVEFTLASLRLEKIKNLLGLRTLLVLTSGGEWEVQGNLEGPITPSSVQARPQSYHGNADLAPITVGNVALYVQGTQNVVRELIFDLQTDGYTGADVSLLAQHLFQSHLIKDWAYAEIPFSQILAARDDGKILACTYVREQEVRAWYQYETAGAFENVCAVPEAVSANGALEHVVYAVVQRTINGATKRYIERFATRQGIPRLADGELDTRYAVILDASLSYAGSPRTSFGGLSHLEGCSVKVLADGNVLGPYTVSGGSISIATEMPDGASIACVGLPYVSDLETLDLKMQTVDVKAQVKGVNSVTFEVIDARGLWVGQDFDHLKEWRQRQVADSYGTMAPATTIEQIRFPMRYNLSGRACVRQVDPLPVTLIGFSREVDFGRD